MSIERIMTIKKWIKSMGFELVKSHLINRRNTRINYYSLGNFGVYEEISKAEKVNSERQRKFISWNPWGDHFEVSSVQDLSKAYEDSLTINPELAL